MLENGKMGLLRRVFEAIFGHNVINRHFFKVISVFLGTIRGHRPANLDSRGRLFVTPVDDNNVECVTSGDDGCRWRLFSCCKLFNYPSPADKSATSPARGEVTRLLRCARNDICCSGRSMIEMLGVLAIIGVLSVGGIAGYSKAMEKWKINKSISEYNLIIFSLLEHLDRFKNLSSDKNWSLVSLLDYMQQSGLVTPEWQPISEREFNDPYGNTIAFFSRHNNLVIDLTIGGLLFSDENITSPSFSAEMCKEYFSNTVIPLQSSLLFARLYMLTGNSSTSTYFYGNSICNNRTNCLKTMTLNDINTLCNSCTKDSACVINLEF